MTLQKIFEGYHNFSTVLSIEKIEYMSNIINLNAISKNYQIRSLP